MTEPMSVVTPMEDAAASASTARRDLSLRFLVRSAAALVSTTALTSGLGFIYWAAGARFFPAAAVGAGATAISAMTLLATFATLGFGTLLMSRLPAVQSRRVDLLVSTSLLSGLTGAALALLAALALPESFLGLPEVGTAVWPTLFFAAGVSATAVSLVLDQGLLSLLGGGPQLGRNAVLSIAKLALLVVFALTLTEAGAASIYTSCLIGNVLSIAALAVWAVARHRIQIGRVRPSPALLRGLRRDATEHHALNLALQVPYFAMPIVASAVLGAEDAGYLYATWAIAGFVFVLPIALSTSLFASGARNAAGFTKQLRVTLRFSLLACLAANAVLFPLGGLVLHLFGENYAGSGRWVLALVCLGGLPLIIKDHHVSVARVIGTVGREATLVWILSVAELAGATVGAHLGGLTGLATGWLGAVVLEGLVCLPLVLRARAGRIPGLSSAT